MTKKLYERAKLDVSRKHPFAYERISFLLGKVGRINGEPQMILMYDLISVDDNDYERAEEVGARIGNNAIRTILQCGLDTGCSIFHTHAHFWPGIPDLSPTDINSIPPLIKSFQNVNPNIPHGIFLFSENYHAGWTLLPSKTEITAVEKISVIGNPMSFTPYV